MQDLSHQQSSAVLVKLKHARPGDSKGSRVLSVGAWRISNDRLAYLKCRV